MEWLISEVKESGFWGFAILFGAYFGLLGIVGAIWEKTSEKLKRKRESKKLREIRDDIDAITENQNFNKESKQMDRKYKIVLGIFIGLFIASFIAIFVSSKISYENGFAQTSRYHAAGYERGYEDGHDSGYYDGWDDGYQEGRSFGYDDGYNMGSYYGQSGKASTPTPSSQQTDEQFFWSTGGERYHYSDCRYVNQINLGNLRSGSLSDAKTAGKTPCQVCRPPS